MNLINNLDKLHTTKLGIQRIKRNLSLEINDVISWCKNKILSSKSKISKQGKNYYVKIENYIFTINSNNYSIITAHKTKNK